MKYIVNGMGAKLSADEIEFLPFCLSRQKPIKGVIEARSKEDALYKAYEELEGGFWQGDVFVWFSDEPEISPLPEDLLMRLMNCPTLPGLS